MVAGYYTRVIAIALLPVLLGAFALAAAAPKSRAAAATEGSSGRERSAGMR